MRPFVSSFLIVLFILELQFISTYKDFLVGKGLGFWVIFQVIYYASAQLIVLGLPLSVLISSLMTLGSLGENYELAAIRASGISLVRVLMPMGIVVLGVTTFSLYFSAEVVPKSNLKLYSLLHDIQESKPALQLKPGYFFSGIEGYSILIGDKKTESNKIYKVIIYDHTSGQKNDKVVLADSGKMKVYEDYGILLMTLYNGGIHQGYQSKNKFTQAYSRTYFDTLVFRFDVSGIGLKRSDEGKFVTHQYMQNLSELSASIDSCKKKKETHQEEFHATFSPFLKSDSSLIANEATGIPPVPDAGMLSYFRNNLAVDIINNSEKQARAAQSFIYQNIDEIEIEGENVRNYQIEFHRKFSLPIACIIFLFIGAPLGAIIRKGGIGLPIVVSIFFYILFYVLHMMGRQFGRDQIMPVWSGVWLPILTLTPLGIFLTYQSSIDSQIFQKSYWEAVLYPVRRFFWLLVTGRIFRAGYYQKRWDDLLAGGTGSSAQKQSKTSLVSFVLSFIFSPLTWLFGFLKGLFSPSLSFIWKKIPDKVKSPFVAFYHSFLSVFSFFGNGVSKIIARYKPKKATGPEAARFFPGEEKITVGEIFSETIFLPVKKPVGLLIQFVKKIPLFAIWVYDSSLLQWDKILDRFSGKSKSKVQPLGNAWIIQMYDEEKKEGNVESESKITGEHKPAKPDSNEK